MTRSVTVVNTSNWKGENILVDEHLLQPGDYVTLALTDHNRLIAVSPVPEATKPYKLNNVQFFPEVKVNWVSPSDEMSDFKFKLLQDLERKSHEKCTLA